ncbi:microtubule associated protein-like protein [Leishmania tarentolae]|uniref:Microtubule associated protein-like protein n=2 Tax=Leishmania tarentolae TaxID=5689 RepID=A0A640K9G1_LEITA|nr:microtubule associated protein-like protein [Leishmania tarentolae]
MCTVLISRIPAPHSPPPKPHNHTHTHIHTTIAMSAYVSSTPLEARVAKCASLRAANAVPVVVEEAQARGGKVHFSALARETTVAQLVAAVRGFRGVDARKPVTLTVAGCSVSPSATLGQLHDACKQADDGMLYVAYTAERRMGAAMCTPCGSCGWN